MCRSSVDKELLAPVVLKVRRTFSSLFRSNERVELNPSEFRESCPITFDAFQDLAARGELISAQCGHKFSKGALETWLMDHTNCPTCQSDVTSCTFIAVSSKVKHVAEPAFPEHSDSSASSSSYHDGMGFPPFAFDPGLEDSFFRAAILDSLLDSNDSSFDKIKDYYLKYFGDKHFKSLKLSEDSYFKKIKLSDSNLDMESILKKKLFEKEDSYIFQKKKIKFGHFDLLK
jgi:hypothetical protein